MSVKLAAKTALFKVLDYLPEGPAYDLYHLAQERFGGGTLDGKINSTESTFRMFDKIAKDLNVVLEGKRILEIGSGWLPLMPYHLIFSTGAEKVISFDIRRHYQKKPITKLNRFFSSKYNVEINARPPYELPEQVEYHPNTDVAKVAKLDVQVVFSRFVLEHVNPQDLREMHQNLKEKLQKGSYIFHFISPSDHRAYTDKNLSLQDFLRFSEADWDKMTTRFDYHNRWRLPQYLQLFRELGFEIVYLNYDNPPENSETYKKFKNIQIHSDFAEYNEEELTAGAINVILKV